MNNLQILWVLLLLIACSFCTSENKTKKNDLNVKHKLNKPQNFIKQKQKFNWLSDYKTENILANKIKAPIGFVRNNTNAFGSFLRSLPLNQSNKVYLFNGNLKANQQAQFAVLNIDVGKKDLQQCADAVMRLRAEYLFHTKKQNQIHFNFTSGHKCSWQYWQQGFRPKINGNKVEFKKIADANASYLNFKKYLQTIFTYAGTSSLQKELKNKTLQNLQTGDVFIQGGFPGHAILVADVVENETGEKLFLLAQSYMPAQQIHILKNYNNTSLSPWYSLKNLKNTKVLKTPEWTFYEKDLFGFE